MAEIDLDDFDFGFTTVSGNQLVDSEEHTHQLVAQSERVNKIKAMIMPLLTNLMKGDGEYIRWPDRKEKIQQFIDKLNLI